MEDKIKLYEEMLAMDPGSRLFFPLAKLYRQNKDPQKAISTLYSGLEKHPEHLEARLLILQLLAEQGDGETDEESLNTVTGVLESYPDFWSNWAHALEREGKKDLALAMRFIGYNFSGMGLAWSDVFYSGLANICESGSPGVQECQQVANREEAEGLESEQQNVYMKEASQLARSGEEQYRTKTMADILAEQGDYAEAIDIYEELYQNARDKEEKKKLKQILEQLKGEENFDAQDRISGVEERKQQFVQRLSSLAGRLEARGV